MSDRLITLSEIMRAAAKNLVSELACIFHASAEEHDTGEIGDGMVGE